MLFIVLMFAAPLLWLAAPVLVYIVPLVALSLAMRGLAGRMLARR
jgi:hypothetical protein